MHGTTIKKEKSVQITRANTVYDANGTEYSLARSQVIIRQKVSAVNIKSHPF